MNKILVATVVMIAWAGTLYGAYSWGSKNGPSDAAVSAAERRAVLCSMGREDFQDANKALDKLVTYREVSLPLRAWGRERPDIALGKEAAYQEDRRLRAGDTIAKGCFADD